ncbi:PEP-CTERM sorting domain-containing protein [Crocosphaera sp. XPORK-15E]|uniref:PEP-CTERM sorting domain-containing protein n=1 Tax=Crocosphaera sp. XPORK-15E TaxID=3110247 RepID=UPI002B1FDA0C|nr:PEP-CTERM sorting domain-containing protein [Crocosphaera sp. XPORK-15E]MEA5532429.1 PEP-CTERM sorting domain-containing protein [Crocosphaera sp. XPORK-15E]
MTILNPPKFVTRSLIGAVGLSAIAFFGVTESVKAADINAGIDYLFTPLGSDTWVDFDQSGPMGRVYFKGVPVLPGGADTAVERLNDCDFDATGKCTIDLQFVSLNLMSVTPVAEFGNQNVFLMLDDTQTQPVSSMTLMDMGNMASWTNTLDFYWKLVDSQNNILQTGFESFIGSGLGTYDSNGGFIVKTYDDSAAWARHTDKKIPEPSTTLGLLLLGLGSVAGIKRKGSTEK